MTIEHEVSKELPDYLYAVVADVDPRSNISTAKTLSSIAPTPNWSVQRAHNHEELFNKALHGDVVGGAKLIVLDDDYTNKWEEWVFSGTKRGEQLVKKLMRRGMNEIDAYWFSRAEAVNFAAALRLFGYDGKIIVTSLTALNEEIIRTAEKDLGDIFLIDGISLKSNSIKPLSAVHRKKIPSGVKLDVIQTSEKFEDSLSWLLARVLG